MTEQQQQKLNELLEQAIAAAGGDVDSITSSTHEVKRKAQHKVAIAAQPVLGLGDCPAGKAFIAEFLKPLEPNEGNSSAPALSYLYKSARESALGGDFETLIYDLLRFFRNAWAINKHLGPIAPVSEV